MNSSLRLALLLSLAWLCGCTNIAEIRTHHGTGQDVPVINADKPSEGCSDAASTQASRANSIEDYQDYWAGFVEFDDEGWLYNSHDQLSQMEVLRTRLQQELNDPAFVQTDFLVVAFVHGWHHNAHDSDCNVHEFRAMLKVANDRYAAASRQDPLLRHRRIIGVYAGWRGESVNVEGLNVTTVLDRRNAAERVAKGDVRELFAQLRSCESFRSASRKSLMRARIECALWSSGTASAGSSLFTACLRPC